MKKQHYQITIVGIAIAVVAVSVTVGLSTYYFSSPTPLSSELKSSNTTHDHESSNTAETSAFPSGSNLTRAEISQLFELFDDQPLEGGQVPPRISKWVNNDTFIFLQFDKPVAENATSLRYVGIGVKGVFCAESQPDAVNGSFTHFHQWNGSEYRHAHGSQPGDQGYWLTWAAVDNFVSFDGKEVKPGIDYEFSPTPPPTCGENVPAVDDFPVSGPEKMPKEEILQLASFFDDQPFLGGQESPRLAKWVNNDTFMFLQFDKPSLQNATAINYIGIGSKGLFCKENQPTSDFTHFHKWNATEYRHGHGSLPGEEGYWLLWIAADEFETQGRHVTPGVDREFSPTPPPSCSI